MGSAQFKPNVRIKLSGDRDAIKNVQIVRIIKLTYSTVVALSSATKVSISSKKPNSCYLLVKKHAHPRILDHMMRKSAMVAILIVVNVMVMILRQKLVVLRKIISVTLVV